MAIAKHPKNCASKEGEKPVWVISLFYAKSADKP